MKKIFFSAGLVLIAAFVLALTFNIGNAAGTVAQYYGKYLYGRGEIYSKNADQAPYFLYFVNRDGTLKFTVDSTGTVSPAMAAGTTTTYSPTTKGTLDLGTSTLYWRSIYTATIFNKSTSFLDSSGNVNITGYLKSANAGIDSFSTTSATKTETVTGAAVGDAVIVTPLCPAYSATPDTGQMYSGYVSAAGIITILRSPKQPGATAKSVAEFNWMYLRQH